MLREEIIKRIQEILSPAETLKALAGKVSDFKSQVETIRDEAQEKHDNLSDKARDGEKGEELSAAIDAAEEIVTELETAETALQNDAIGDGAEPDELTEILEEAVASLENAAEKISEL